MTLCVLFLCSKIEWLFHAPCQKLCAGDIWIDRLFPARLSFCDHHCFETFLYLSHMVRAVPMHTGVRVQTERERERVRERDARARTHTQTNTHTNTYLHTRTYTHTNTPHTLSLSNTHRYAVITSSDLFLAQEDVENSKALVKIPLQEVIRVEGSMTRCVCVLIYIHTHTHIHTHTLFPRVCLRVRASACKHVF
jgi:hypothetical protein